MVQQFIATYKYMLSFPNKGADSSNKMFQLNKNNFFPFKAYAKVLYYILNSQAVLTVLVYLLCTKGEILMC